MLLMDLLSFYEYPAFNSFWLAAPHKQFYVRQKTDVRNI